MEHSDRENAEMAIQKVNNVWAPGVVPTREELEEKQRIPWEKSAVSGETTTEEELSKTGKESGETLSRRLQTKTRLEATLEWTYPLSHLEVVSGDGEQVYRNRNNLSGTKEFGSTTINQAIDLTGRKWARIEVWAIAKNGAFTQPVWID